LPAWLATRAAQLRKSADSDISSLSIHPDHWTEGCPKGSTIFQAANGFRRNDSAAPTKPLSRADEAGLKPNSVQMAVDQISRFGHVGHHHQLILPPFLPVEFD
jgi:hypothetical protein